jgi:hypothetical protein
VQVPAASRSTEKPLTVQIDGVVDATETVSPELAVALTVIGDWRSVAFGGFANAIVWATLVIVNVRVIGVAARYVAFPGCVAVIEHVPGATNVMTNPLTVHTGVLFDVSVTGRFDVAVAVTFSGDWGIVEFGGFANVMVWLTWLIVKVRVMGAAG